jgi:hypothetical protein
MTVTALAQNQIKTTNTNTGSTLTAASATVTQSFSKQFTTSDVSKTYANARTTSGETLDLTATLADIYGTTINLSTLKYLYVENTDTTKTLTVGTGSNPALGSDQFTIGPGQCVVTTHPYTIDGTHKNLKFAVSSGSLVYNLVLVGA